MLPSTRLLLNSRLRVSRFLPLYIVQQQRCYAHVCNALQHNDYLSKYQEKLLRKAKAEGVATVTELLKQKKDATEHKQNRQTYTEGQQNSAHNVAAPLPKMDASHPSGKGTSPANSGLKSLSQILDMDKLTSDGVPTDDIGKIWTAYHSNKPNLLSAVIPAETYRIMSARAKEFPIFVLPKPGPNDTGYELYLLQWSFNTCMFTSLAEYKTVGAEAARPYLTLTHHTDLAKDKGIVLMRGEISQGNNGNSLLSVQHAQLLAMLLQDFYGVTGGEQKRKLLELFHKNPNEFDVDRLVEAVNRIGEAK